MDVLHELLVRLMAEGAGELGLVDVTVTAELAGALDHRRGLTIDVGLALLVFHLLPLLEREADGFKKQQYVVLDALLIDLLDQSELLLRAVGLGRLKLGEELDGIGAAA